MNNQEIYDEIKAQNQLPLNLQGMANAILLGRKCADCSLQEIHGTCVNIINKMLVFYGNKNPSDALVTQMRDLCADEFKTYHGQLTIEELDLGINMAARGFYGEVPGYNFSFKLLSALIGLYKDSNPRKAVLKAIRDTRDNGEIKPHKEEITDDKMVQIMVAQFERYKQDPESVIISFTDYNILHRIGVALPDYAQFTDLATADTLAYYKLKRMQVPEVPDRNFKNLVHMEEKRQALRALYNSLIEQGKTLQQYVESFVVPA